MYVATIPNRNSRPAILLREGYRENGKVKNRTLKNLSDWPAERVELLRTALRGDSLAPAGMEIERALPHGHVLAALGTARAIELDALLPRGKERRHQLALALIVARVLAPSAKLATARALDPATASHSLGATLELGPVKVKELYATLDGLGKHQEGIERRLARRHLGSGTLVLYDVTSSYLEGRHCPLARRGYSRDGKKGKLQIVFGLICNAAGCPVAVEVFEGHCGDPATLSAPLDKLKRRFGLRRMVLVGDRGLITSARIDEDLRPAGFDWMTALRAPALAKLAGEEGPLQLSLFDQRGLAEIDSPDYPGQRLIACRNPALAAERARKREELLAATDVELRRIQGRVRRARRPLRGAGEIGLAVGAVINRRKVADSVQCDAFTASVLVRSAKSSRDGSCPSYGPPASSRVSAAWRRPRVVNAAAQLVPRVLRAGAPSARLGEATNRPERRLPSTVGSLVSPWAGRTRTSCMLPLVRKSGLMLRNGPRPRALEMAGPAMPCPSNLRMPAASAGGGPSDKSSDRAPTVTPFNASEGDSKLLKAYPLGSGDGISCFPDPPSNLG